MDVKIADFPDGGRIPERFVCGACPSDVLHWVIFDIPGTAKGLPEGVKSGERADGANQINNFADRPGYFGPCPPPGHGDHHYALELYALDAKLGLPANDIPCRSSQGDGRVGAFEGRLHRYFGAKVIWRYRLAKLNADRVYFHEMVSFVYLSSSSKRRTEAAADHSISCVRIAVHSGLMSAGRAVSFAENTCAVECGPVPR